MENPQYKRGHIGIFNEHVELSELRRVDRRAILGLFFSKSLLYIGFILILLNNLNVFAPGSYFGAFSWVTVTVFSFGLVINFISIPYLYFSSYKNFQKENDFWDKETFWILPLFFFGTFFLYGSQITAALGLLIVSVISISLIHLKFIHLSWKNWRSMLGHNLASHEQYLMTMKYLTVYYLMLFALLILCNPLQQVMVWIRLHF